MSVEARFFQIHTLTSYPAALLNRDDSGLAKRLKFGGTTRTRISSQCLKRHWRIGDGEHSLKTLGVPMSLRSRKLVERGIVEPLTRDGVDLAVADVVGMAFLTHVFDAKPEKKHRPTMIESPKGLVEIGELRTEQALFFGELEIAYLRAEAKKVCAEAAGDAEAAGKAAEAYFTDRDVKANIRALKETQKGAAGLEAALFGRMITSDPEANTDAAIHVAHAFTVHGEESESDYFTVVDDLKNDRDDAGAAGIFDTELTSGLYYGYVVVDVPLLVSNLEGVARADWAKDGSDRTLAGRVVERLAHLIAKVSPGAKLGSTAPYAWSQLMLIEAGARQPRTLADAFRIPVSGGSNDTLGRAFAAMNQQLLGFDTCYGAAEIRRFASPDPNVTLAGADRVVFDALAAWTRDCVVAARA